MLPFPVSSLLAALASACLIGAATAAPARLPTNEALPTLALPEAGTSGERAIELLGGQLEAVARAHGRSAESLRGWLRRDARLRVDRHGRLFMVEEMEAPLAARPASAGEATAAATAAADQTFLLHSRAGAPRTIYLNFQGAVLQNTAWTGSASVTARPFDIDGDETSFSSTELARIQAIWQRVAEDFAPFDVDVTTEAPPADKLSRSGVGDSVFGTTVLITHNSGVYSCSCGGVAYIGAIDDTSDYYKPALVFWNMLGNGNEKYVAEAISHEAGHNLGLLHDGTASTGYYSGQGDWAPIMGVGYYKPLVQWSKGEYSGANNTEDDFAVAISHGVTLRADDHGGDRSTATPLTVKKVQAVRTLSGAGVIEQAGDQDFFSFRTGAGTVSLTLSVDSLSPNLNARLQVINGRGKVVASADPTGTLGASLSFTAAATAKYYVVVDGVGEGSASGTGYSSYGSVGQYRISGTAPAP